MKLINLKRIQSLPIGLVVPFFLFLFSLIIPFDKVLAAQSEKEKTAVLVDGAKKERKVVWYTTTPANAADKFVKKFQEKYPFIEFDVYRSSASKTLTKVLAEARAKRHNFDVINTNVSEAEIMKGKGLLAKYLSPEREFYSTSCKDAEGYWTDTFLNLNTIGYNTRLVSPREAPKTWEDLLNPKWKRKMSMDTKAFDWFANMLKIMGEKKGLAYFENLAKQEIKFITGRTLNAQMLAAGEVSIGITLYNYGVEELKSKGAPVEWVAIEPVVSELHPLAVSAHAAHPHASRLFVDFMLSREGQEIMAGTFRIPSRRDVEAKVPRLKKGIKILPFDFSIAGDYEKYVKLYGDVLMKR